MSGERPHRSRPSSDSIPSRVHSIESRMTTLEKRVRSLSDGDSSLGDGDLVGKKVRLCITGSVEDEQVEGEVIGVSKYTIKIKVDSKVRTYRKGYIRWHEEL